MDEQESRMQDNPEPESQKRPERFGHSPLSRFGLEMLSSHVLIPDCRLLGRSRRKVAMLVFAQPHVSARWHFIAVSLPILVLFSQAEAQSSDNKSQATESEPSASLLGWRP